MTQKLPENFNNLHGGEEFLRAKSIEAIEASEDFLLHARMIERVMDLLDYFCRNYVSESEDILTVQLLAIRLFNGAGSAFKLLLSGYYQTSALVQRDMLETIFLLQYFSGDRALIAKWRGSDSCARQNDFGPAVVRKALDKRDGFTERKRDKAYKLLCELAAHPTYEGFRMLAPRPGGDANCGPFFEATSFKAVYEEFAKHMVQVGSSVMHFLEAKTPEDQLMKIVVLEAQGEWAEKFFGHTFNRKELGEMRLALEAALAKRKKT